MVRINDRCTNRTDLAAEYGPNLCRAWAGAAKCVYAGSRSRALADWKRLARLMAGDVESNPGPRRRSMAMAVSDILVDDITQLTVTRYSKALDKLDAFLRERDLSISHVARESGPPALATWTCT